MRKVITTLLIVFIMCSTLTVQAVVPEESYQCTVFESDISGTNYQLYLMGCWGHFNDDSVTVYLTNTSKKAIEFQVCVGYSGSEEHPTSVESGFVELEPGVTGKFVLENLSNYPEKANTDLGYVPNSRLGRGSVVRIQARNIQVGDTFLICGIPTYGRARDTSFKEIEPNAIMASRTNYGYINDARLVIKKEVEEKEVVEYTLVQPDSETVDNFLIFVVASAIICVGGIIIYVYTFITKRRENDD